MEQYEEGHCKVCRAMYNLPKSEGRASKASEDTQAIAYTEVEVGRDRYGFYFGLPKAPTEEDSIWVVVNHITKSAHFIPMKVKDTMDKLANYMFRI